MTSTYMHVSNKYVFPRLNGITELLALEDPAQINDAVKKLADDAQVATADFRKELEDDYVNQQMRIINRVDQITCLINVLKEDPDIKDGLDDDDDDMGVADFN
ncbi:unnamed protein product [Anisakis simplex]|uniref:EKC/KEOPS complex subunit GON7 n=1 Tax=Anisakis simplex TaxID=6269 RepID=A0A0M3J6V5_ANISI|nr:unnamed protein product [Anisakis simplex]